ncbi:MAG: sigma factor-like helix-turn-helix DNA-binding protein [Blautia sp.]
MNPLRLSPKEKEIVRRKFYCCCAKVVRGEALNYFDELQRLHEHEICFSELLQEEWNQLSRNDDLEEQIYFQIMDMDVPVKDAEIAAALKRLPEKKRMIILMAYFLDMTEQEIAEYLHLVQSTVHYHKADSLRLLREIME